MFFYMLDISFQIHEEWLVVPCDYKLLLTVVVNNQWEWSFIFFLLFLIVRLLSPFSCNQATIYNDRFLDNLLSSILFFNFYILHLIACIGQHENAPAHSKAQRNAVLQFLFCHIVHSVLFWKPKDFDFLFLVVKGSYEMSWVWVKCGYVVSVRLKIQDVMLNWKLS